MASYSGDHAAKHSRDSINLRGSTIAVIDDEPAILDSMRLLLEVHGANVLAFQSAFDFLRANPQSNCLVVDYHMPEMNGLALISDLQKRGDRRPAIMITAVNDPTLEQRARVLGVRKVLHKPIGAQALIDEVRTLIGNGGSVAD